MFAQTTGTRALRSWKRLLAYLGSRMQRGWQGEDLAGSTSDPLPEVLPQLELQAAQTTNARYLLEYAESFTLTRDLRYRRRNRRWLWAKAQQAKLDACYEQWAGYARQNRDTLKLADLPGMDAEQLAALPFAAALATPPVPYTNLVVVQKS
jgi:hypothetical protein